MRESNIPLPNISDNDHVEIEVSVGSRKQKHYYRLESVPWKKDSDKEKKELSSSERIEILKKAIENYDKNRELIQIFASLEKSLNVQNSLQKKVGSH